jgi:uncharacterized membrane protein
MVQQRRPWSQIFLLVCSLLGAAMAIYLTAVHYNEGVPLFCSNSGVVNCGLVLSSPYALVPGTSIPISIPGLAWCVIMAMLAIVGLRTQPVWLRPAQFIWALVGILTALYLVYVEIVRLHAICAWCSTLHVLILLTFLVTLVRLTSPAPEPEQLEAENAHSEKVESTHPPVR